jgi:hypothetical protein
MSERSSRRAWNRRRGFPSRLGAVSRNPFDGCRSVGFAWAGIRTMSRSSVSRLAFPVAKGMFHKAVRKR